VIWFFDRGGEKIVYEIRRDADGFLLVMSSATGQKRVERVAHPTELIERSTNQLRRLHDDGWKVG
jgi:aminoglycoside phosphotransferase